ncbi:MULTISPECIES: hypothetical protein [unclassified Shewanella]|uniref:hypothetical protein n=2 Tax=unclassified Shewanella TaxID=196818 RepID=UPI000CAEBC0F|nr:MULTISPECIES: hypothetical protein [unclassified Shewanella]MDO6775029.1 hypothetical protein [Shewanella sp. 3_MG-2023]PMG26931.1 hypothetical protein BCU94_04980 [Shewanella sp. 10N.286.52.C2]PMG50252.1 hypothetical protein BCU91_02020 [Shewanella sp. 10N.286.52.B9]PMH87253.1 hypothetical protein BCU57_01135 [Shewanella sp. 10N.286.48.B5]PMH99967.1 hypothetical protein BCU55_13030 [Shewanella sp. 10N.286.48.A6]
MGMPRWNLSDTTENKIRSYSLMLTAAIMLYEYLNGDISTQYPAMYICIFVFPAVYFTNSIQEKYFPLIMEYVQAARLVSIFMTLSSFLIWCYTTYIRLSTPAISSHGLYLQ